MIAVQKLLYGSETWRLKQNGYIYISFLEIAYFRSVKGCTRLYCFLNEDTRQELNVIRITENIDSDRKWLVEELLRTDGSGIEKISLEYIVPKAEEVWDVQERDGCFEVATGQGLNTWQEEDIDDDDNNIIIIKSVLLREKQGITGQIKT